MSKICDYRCGMTIQWDKKESVFRELDGKVHNKQRCESLKQKSVPNKWDDTSLDVLLKKLASIGISIDLQKLRNASI